MFRYEARAILRLAVALAVLATPSVFASPAAAATPVGSPHLSSASTGDLFCDFFPCVLVLDRVDGVDVDTPKGVITSWSARKATGTVALRVLRTRPGEFVSDQLHAANVSESPDETGGGSDAVQTFDTHQPVEQGDYIGVTLVTGSSIGYLVGSSGDQIFEVDGDPNAGNVDNPTTRNKGPDNFEPLLLARVEPDADGDGFGDESEDACPSNAATQGACPAGPATTSAPPFVPPFVAPVSTAATKRVTLGSRSATFKRGKASIRLANPNAARVSGKVKLRLGKKLVGSRAYSLAAGASGTITVKLANAARERIRKRGKVSLSLSLTAKGATGRSFKTTAKLTVRKAAKPKPKKPQPTEEKDDGKGAFDGKYAGAEGSGPKLSFTVTDRGRRIVTLTGSVGGYCSTYVPFQGVRSEFRTLFAGIDSLAVAADGTFAGTETHSDTTTEITNGKLAGGVATGTVKVNSSGCISGAQAFTSNRTGP